jgi:SET domain-containing protein
VKLPPGSARTTAKCPVHSFLCRLALGGANQADQAIATNIAARRMPKYPFRVGRSRTGLGLFATEPIKKRAFIVEYKGPRLTNAEADRLEARGSKYMYQVNDKWTIDGSSRKNIARYANHSCRPNAESDTVRGKNGGSKRGGRVIIRAIKNIKPGEEILYDYGDEYFKYVITPERCQCDKCRAKRAKKRAAKRAAAATAKSARKTTTGSRAKSKAGPESRPKPKSAKKR